MKARIASTDSGGMFRERPSPGSLSVLWSPLH